MLRLIVLLLVYAGLVLERVSDRVFVGYWQSPLRPLGDVFFTSLPGIRLPLWDLLFVAVIALAHLQPGALRRRSRPLDTALLLAGGALGLWCAWGLVRGGSPYQMFFQLHAFVLMLVAARGFTTVLRNDRAFLGLGLTILAAALTRAGMGCMFFFWVVRPRGLYPRPSYVTSHDDSVLFVCGLVILVSYVLTRRSLLSLAAAAPAVLVLLFLVTLNQRRLAWIALLVALAIIYLQLPRGRLRRRVRYAALAAVPLVSLYVLIGRTHGGTLFAPVHELARIYGAEADDSAKARDLENAGLVSTLREHPIMGTGWGHEYKEVAEDYAPGLRRVFPQYLYIPHNSLLGVAAFMGPIGFSSLWLVFTVGCVLAARAYRAARTSVARAATLSAAPVLTAYLIQAYGDMGMQSLTVSLIGAAALAVAGRYAVLTGAWPDRRRRRRPPQGVAVEREAGSSAA